jgi:hypothetical protein
MSFFKRDVAHIPLANPLGSSKGEMKMADEFYDIPAIQAIFKEVWSNSETEKEVATWVVRNARPPIYDRTGLKIGMDTHANPGRPPSNAILQVHTHPRKWGSA